MDHAGRETKSHILRHCLNSNHETVSIGNFKILNMRYNNNTYKRRISEALFGKQCGLSLNMQGNSVPLQLFNWSWLCIYSKIVNNLKFLTFRILLYELRNLLLWWWPLENEGRIYSKGKMITSFVFLTKENV